jgi:predicted DNA binding CopG/RHH family protein
MSDTIDKPETVKFSCYLDKESYEEFKNKAFAKGLSFSAYLRFLIKKELKK